MEPHWTRGVYSGHRVSFGLYASCRLNRVHWFIYNFKFIWSRIKSCSVIKSGKYQIVKSILNTFAIGLGFRGPQFMMLGFHYRAFLCYGKLPSINFSLLLSLVELIIPQSYGTLDWSWQLLIDVLGGESSPEHAQAMELCNMCNTNNKQLGWFNTHLEISILPTLY